MYELRLVRERRAGYPTPRASLPNSEAVVRAFRAHFAALDREQVLVVLLDTKNKPLGFHVVSTGTLNASLVHPRELFKIAIVASAASVIVLHNHPSGDPLPSAEDYAITQRLVAAGKLLGISLVDSIVVGEDDSYFSFADAGRLEDAQEIRERAAETVCEPALRVGCYARGFDKRSNRREPDPRPPSLHRAARLDDSSRSSWTRGISRATLRHAYAGVD